MNGGEHSGVNWMQPPSKMQAASHPRLVNFAALSTWLIASIFLAITSFMFFGMDFRGYYAAARLVLLGGNPYDYTQLAPILQSVTGHMGNNPYFYPPWFAWFFIPLSWMPFEIARSLWMVFNLVVWCIGLWQLGKLIDWPESDWRRSIAFLFATLLFAWITLRFEQTGILLFALSIAALTCIRQEKWTWAGIWLALLLIKPNITLIPVAAVCAWLIRRRWWRPVISMSLVLVGLLLTSFVITPGWYRPLFQSGFSNGLFYVLDGPDKVVDARLNTTLSDWLMMLGVSIPWRVAIQLTLGVIGLIVVTYLAFREDSLLRVAVVSVLFTFAVTPYVLQYDFPLLALPLIVALHRMARSRGIPWVGLMLSVFMASVLIWERPISDGYWIVIGMSALSLWSWTLTRSTTKPKLPK